LWASDMGGYYWGDHSGISGDVGFPVSRKLQDPTARENVDKFIQKTVKGFPLKKCFK
jgi:hypothetical protein